MKYSGAGWDSREISEDFIASIKAIAKYILEEEKFTSLAALRKGGLPKIELTKLYERLKTPDNLLVGARGIDNFESTRDNGEVQGTLLLFKDKVIFVTSAVYNLKSYEEGHKAQEMLKVASDIKNRAIQNQLDFMGSPDSFSLSRPYHITKEEISVFLSDIKKAFEGVKLRIV